jgi:uncharacterized DUF497 family protein
MRFEWDKNKNRRNLAKHRVDFETAKLVFEDPYLLLQEDRAVDGEQRWKALGLIGGAVLLLVVHTYWEDSDEEVLRLISARKAAGAEKKAYEEAHKKPS